MFRRPVAATAWPPRMDATRPPPHRAPSLSRHLLVLALPLAFAGCPAMSTPVDTLLPPGVAAPSGPGIAPGQPGYRNPPEAMDTSRPFTFDKHNFGAYCYETYGCRIDYAGHLQTIDEDDVLQPSLASIGPNYLAELDGGHIGIANFPPPARITWRSKDGEPHQAEVDIGEIFKDRIIRHNVPRNELPTDTIAAMTPDIVLVVEDRTISVYMRAHVATRTLQIPGNKYSGNREDMILAWRRNY